MRSPRRGLAHRFTAILLVVAMPFCCCIVNAATGNSCCAPTEVVEAPSCCSSQHCQPTPSEQEPESEPCTGGDCTCCLKAPVMGFEWTPPVDTIGTQDLHDLFQVELFSRLMDLEKCPGGWDDQPPPQAVGPSQLRGLVIFQV